MAKILITGSSSGLGKALCQLYLQKGYDVYALGKNDPGFTQPNFEFTPCDLSQLERIGIRARRLIGQNTFDAVWLNAGMLGPIADAPAISLQAFEEVMDLNVWANKVLLDLLVQNEPDFIGAISSGASQNGSKGWGPYSVSKAALNMLVKTYAHHFTKAKLLALAPGVVQTPMVKHIINQVDDARYPSAKKLKNGPIQTPQDAAMRLYEVFKDHAKLQNGTFVDIRNL
ncbi:MAG: SDR family NAD(P)-dependent oxidoreductase [Campylobacterota bacterium]